MDLKYILNSPDVERIASSLETIATDAVAAITGKVDKQQSTSDAGKALVIGSDGKLAAGGAVRYDVTQAMTNTQKAQAQENIGAAAKANVPFASGIYTTGNNPYTHLSDIPQNTLVGFDGAAYASFGTECPFDSQGFGVFVETISPNSGSMTGGIQRVMSWSGSSATNKIAVRACVNVDGVLNWRNWIVYDAISEADFDSAVTRIGTLEDEAFGMLKKTISSASDATGVYASMDTFPKNSAVIVLSGAVSSIAKFPSDYHATGTVITLNGYSTNGGTAQMVFFSNGFTATRRCVDTESNTWSDWVYSGIYYRTFKVRSSGGDFSNVAAALKNVMDSGRANEHYRYIIDIGPGTFAIKDAVVGYIAGGMSSRGLYVMPYTTIKGAGKDRTKITFEYTGTDENIKEYVSGLNAPYTCWIEDLTLSVSEIRYAIHSDNATEQGTDTSTLTNPLLNDNKITLKNVRLEHLGFANITADVAANKYRAPAAWGGGSWNATDREFINCDFYAKQYTAWLNHDRLHDNVTPTPNYLERPSTFTFKNCTFTAATGLSSYTGIAANAASSACSLISWGSGVKTHVSFEGCHAAPCVGMSVITTYNAQAVVDYIVTADNDLYIVESQTNNSQLNDNFRTGNCIAAVCTSSAGIIAYKPVSQEHIKYVANFNANWVRHGIALHSCGQYDMLIVQIRGPVSLPQLGATGFSSGNLIGYSNGAWAVTSTNPILRVIDQYTAEFI